MISCEELIFTPIATSIRASYSGAYVVGEILNAPATFPAVSIVEMDNTALRTTQDSGSNENDVEVMYEVNVYSNKVKGKKAETKAIIALIDGWFTNHGFTRMFCQPIQNLDDATIYRMVARYRAIISKDFAIYRR